MSSIDEFIPYGTCIVECPECGRIFSEYEAYFAYNDGYDSFPEEYDPENGITEDYFCTRCPSCGQHIDAVFVAYAEGYNMRKKDPPIRNTGFSLQKPSGFSLRPSGFSLFSRRKRK